MKAYAKKISQNNVFQTTIALLTFVGMNFIEK